MMQLNMYTHSVTIEANVIMSLLCWHRLTYTHRRILFSRLAIVITNNLLSHNATVIAITNKSFSHNTKANCPLSSFKTKRQKLNSNFPMVNKHMCILADKCHTYYVYALFILCMTIVGYCTIARCIYYVCMRCLT